MTQKAKDTIEEVRKWSIHVILIVLGFFAARLVVQLDVLAESFNDLNIKVNVMQYQVDRLEKVLDKTLE